MKERTLLAGLALATAITASSSVLASMDMAISDGQDSSQPPAVLNAWDGRFVGGKVPDKTPSIDGAWAQVGSNPVSSSWADGDAPVVGPPADRFASGDVALPLSEYSLAGPNRVASGPAHAAAGLRGWIDEMRFGGLPEPASWIFAVLGFGMIGGALRGFVLANRRLARLRSSDAD